MRFPLPPRPRPKPGNYVGKADHEKLWKAYMKYAAGLPLAEAADKHHLSPQRLRDFSTRFDLPFDRTAVKRAGNYRDGTHR
jgi:hypothetical protein